MYPQRSVMTCGLATALEPPHFNHAPVRGATPCPDVPERAVRRFNPRTRVGCDPRHQQIVLRSACFNPRTRVGCDLSRRPSEHANTRFQSTHPRGVRLARSAPGPDGSGVSIHAPAWGATRLGRPLLLLGYCFNPRTRVGCDLSRHVRHGRGREVSIHAPAWGATGSARRRGTGLSCFNPRTRVGCDPAMPANFSARKSFNPRTRVGCDVYQSHTRLRMVGVSIHAPAWGATAVLILRRACWIWFQSTHPRGVRRLPAQKSTYRGQCFNPRTRVGCDTSSPRAGNCSKTFQSTHPRGVRLSIP